MTDLLINCIIIKYLEINIGYIPRYLNLWHFNRMISKTNTTLIIYKKIRERYLEKIADSEGRTRTRIQHLCLHKEYNSALEEQELIK